MVNNSDLFIIKNSNKGTTFIKLCNNPFNDNNPIADWKIINPFNKKIKFFTKREKLIKAQFEKINLYWSNPYYKITEICWNREIGFFIKLSGPTKNEDSLDLKWFESLFIELTNEINKPDEHDGAYEYRISQLKYIPYIIGVSFISIFITSIYVGTVTYFEIGSLFKWSFLFSICFSVLTFYISHEKAQGSVFYKEYILYNVFLSLFLSFTLLASSLFSFNQLYPSDTCITNTKVLNWRKTSGKSTKYFAEISPLECSQIYDRNQRVSIKVDYSVYYGKPEKINVIFHKGLFLPYAEHK